MPAVRHTRENNTNSLYYTPIGFTSQSYSSSISPGPPVSPTSSSDSHSPSGNLSPFARPHHLPKIPRPANAFLIFRTEYCAAHPTEKHMPEASKKAGAVWKSLSDTEKFPYERRAAIAKEEHALLYPNYRYKPTRKAKTAQKNQWEDMAQKLYAQALKEGGLDALVQSMTSIISGSHPSHNFPVSSELDMVPDVYMPNQTESRQYTVGSITYSSAVMSEIEDSPLLQHYLLNNDGQPWSTFVQDIPQSPDTFHGIPTYCPTPCYPEYFNYPGQDYSPIFSSGPSEFSNTETWANFPCTY